MAGPGPDGGSRPAPLEAALDVELHRFERVAYRVWIRAGATGLVASLVLMASVSYEVGLGGAITTSAYLVWFLLCDRWLLARSGGAGPAVRIAADAVEATIPWTFLTVFAVLKGAEYALASWVPPMLFTMLIFSHAMRLRARACIVVGFVGALVFPVLYFAVIRDRLSAAAAADLVFRSPVQITRSVSMVVIGILAAFGARHLRQAIARAGKVVREQELFGKYRLVKKLARGGMGEVFEALYCPEGGFERRVAVKRIHPHLAEQERFVALFRSEAEICSRLAHPNVVQVMDFGRVERSYFLAMEYVDGITLASFLRGCVARGVEVPEAVAGVIARDILAGLSHAHEVARGVDGRPLRVIHRDLCPQNVLLGRNGEVKITDFGVARALKDADSALTQTVMGHTGYMAPEQALAESVDARADLFSAGVIVWELLAGRRLFQRETDAATVHALVYEPFLLPDIHRPSLDPGWATVLERALSRERDGRFQSAREMAEALERVPSSRAENATRDLAELVTRLADDDAAGDERTKTLTTVTSVPSPRAVADPR